MRADLPCVLVVDDDPVVLGLTVRGLELQGFRCERATCGSELLLLLTEPSRFAALLVDVVLPDVTWDMLRERVAALAPDVPLVAMSGCAHRSVPGAVAFVPKPFSLHAISRTLHDVLETSATARN